MDRMFITLCCEAGMLSGFLTNQARKVAKKRELDTTIEAWSHTDVSGYLSSISISMLGPHYRGELPK